MTAEGAAASFVPAVWANAIAADHAASLARIEANPKLRAMRDMLEPEAERDAALAAAWDEGYDHATSDGYTLEPHTGRAGNPYRTTTNGAGA